MIAPVLCTIATIVVLAWCCAMHPTSWRAPRGWYVNGVRPTGRFEMRPVLGDPERDLEDARQRINIDDERALEGRIYCTGGATPRQDGSSVWCQR